MTDYPLGLQGVVVVAKPSQKGVREPAEGRFCSLIVRSSDAQFNPFVLVPVLVVLGGTVAICGPVQIVAVETN